jgi:hypothetical protein
LVGKGAGHRGKCPICCAKDGRGGVVSHGPRARRAAKERALGGPWPRRTAAKSHGTSDACHGARELLATGEWCVQPSGHGGQCAVSAVDGQQCWRRIAHLPELGRRTLLAARRVPVPPCSQSACELLEPLGLISARPQEEQRRDAPGGRPAPLARACTAGRVSHTPPAHPKRGRKHSGRVGNAQRQRASETPAFRGQRAGVGPRCVATREATAAKLCPRQRHGPARLLAAGLWGSAPHFPRPAQDWRSGGTREAGCSSPSSCSS